MPHGNGKLVHHGMWARGLGAVVEVEKGQREDKKSVNLNSIQLPFSEKEALELSMDIAEEVVPSEAIKWWDRVVCLSNCVFNYLFTIRLSITWDRL